MKLALLVWSHPSHDILWQNELHLSTWFINYYFSSIHNGITTLQLLCFLLLDFVALHRRLLYAVWFLWYSWIFQKFYTSCLNHFGFLFSIPSIRNENVLSVKISKDIGIFHSVLLSYFLWSPFLNRVKPLVFLLLWIIYLYIGWRQCLLHFSIDCL